MTGFTIATVAILVLLLLIFLRMPIGLAMLLCGAVGTRVVAGSWVPVIAGLKSLTYDTFSSYSLSIVPLFLLMGQFATHGGLSTSLFKAASAWLGHRRGGIAMATVGACAGFGAICGSSLATAATMAHVALPEMRRLGYSGALATGCLAAGGTLGILIPPSVVLVIYAILTEQNIAKLFLAAFLPGLLAALGYMLTIAIYVRLWPESARQVEKLPLNQRLRALMDVWPVLLLFMLVIGGIYAGWFTPTEGAAVGAAGTGFFAWRSKRLSLQDVRQCILGTAVSTGMIFFIVLGAVQFNTLLALTQMPQAAADWVATSGFSPWLILAIVLFCYLIFGCVMDSLSMVLLTVPIFFPIVMGLDFGLPYEEQAIWFGILVLVVVEVGLITPPVGLNIFIINSLSPGVPMQDTYSGVLPFVVSDLIRIVILTAIPAISVIALRLLY